MPPLYPLQFAPLLKRYLWGGRRLGTVLGKPIGGESDYAESWEICDHGSDQSRVTQGPLAGQTLGQLVQSQGDALLGKHAGCPKFPLLFKYIDAHDRLSVQVHPNDRQSAQLPCPDSGKTEAWVVLQAMPGSMVYAGLKRGIDRPAFQRGLARGTCELCLHRIEPRAGDCLFLPAGVVHAIGAGLLIAEIQQSSNTTFRLFDFNRTGPSGAPRELHVQAALEVIDFDYGPVQPQVPQATGRAGGERLVACDKFVLDRWTIDAATPLGGDDQCHIVSVLSGEIIVDHPFCPDPMTAGATVLLPASVGSVLLKPARRSVVLDAYLGARPHANGS